MSPPSRKELARRVETLPAARVLLRRLGDAEGVHIVGGAVRDLLMGGRPVDLDLVVEGEAAGLMSRLSGGGKVHDRFGTGTVELGGFRYDVARSRRERYPAPGALPEVEPAALAEDLLRRDFTVNAMAIALGEAERGELRAAPGALGDLHGELLRVLHDESFEDDPTRLLRLARYRGRLGFGVAPETLELARRAIASDALGTVSGTRIGSELRLIAGEADPTAGLSALAELGLDAAIHPSFGLRDEAFARRAFELLPDGARRDRLALAAAGLAVPPPELVALLERLAFEAADRNTIVAAVAGTDRLARSLAAATSSSEIAAGVASAGPELVALAGALGPSDQAREWLERLRQVKLEIDGSDLLAAGVPEGSAVGRGLGAALAAKLDGVAVGREAELACALEVARRHAAPRGEAAP